MFICFYVGNLFKEFIEWEVLQEVFVEVNVVVFIKVIKDCKMGKCWGFVFVMVFIDEVVDEFIEKYNG